jgi:cation diffusion facilitator family transporter
MTDAGNDKEISSLWLSIVGTLFMALLGFTFAWLTDSQAILMDGAFSFINGIVAVITLQVARMIQRPEDETFHFGYAHFEPMLNVIKGLLTLAICVFAAVASVQVILEGGRQLNAGLPILYAVIASGGCFLVAAIIRRNARQSTSEILQVEAKGWLIDGVLSAAVALAFIGMALILRSPWADYARYVDPVLMLVLILAMAPIPLKIVKDNLLELLWIAPSQHTQQQIETTVNDWLGDQPPVAHSLHMVKIGRSIYVQVRLLVPVEMAQTPLCELDELRNDLNSRLELLHPNLIADILFTRDADTISKTRSTVAAS